MRASTKSPKTIDQYLARVEPDKRAALQKLRKAIRAAAPEAVECIAYGIPSFRRDGRYFVGFGAAVKHCAFYPGSAAVRAHAGALKKYGLSTGTIRFQADDPLPAALVRKLIASRIGDR